MVGISGNLSLADDTLVAMQSAMSEIEATVEGMIEDRSEVFIAESNARRENDLGADKVATVEKFVLPKDYQRDEIELGGKVLSEGHKRGEDGQLRSLLNMVQCVSRRVSELSGYMNDAHMAARHQKGILDDSLTLSRVDSGKMTINLEICEMPDLLERASGILRTYAKSKGLQMKTYEIPNEDIAAVLDSFPSIVGGKEDAISKAASSETVRALKGVDQSSDTESASEVKESARGVLSPDKQERIRKMLSSKQKLYPVLRCDDNHLIHILVNFLSNAVKFTPRGAITISAHLRPLSADDLLKLEVSFPSCCILHCSRYFRRESVGAFCQRGMSSG